MSVYSRAEIESKIVTYKKILEGLESCLANIQLTGDIQQYSFQDGQSTINTTYRSASEITKAIHEINSIIERWANKLDGRVTLLRDADVLPRRWL